jgi:hypothetical protein
VNTAGLIFFVVAATAPVRAQLAGPEVLKPFAAGDWTRYYVRRTFTSPERWLYLTADTGMSHVLRDPEEWRGGTAGYAKRYGSATGQRVVKNTAEYLGGLAFRQGTQYRPCQPRGFGARIWCAVRQAVATPQPEGGDRPAYPRFLALSIAPIVASTWKPRPLTRNRFLWSVGDGLLGQAETNLLDEFTPELKTLGRKVRNAIFRR